MHLSSDISSALQQMEIINKTIEESDDPKLQAATAESVKLIIDLLQDPVFRSVINIQDALSELNNQITQHPSILPNDFDINISGNLVLNIPPPTIDFDTDYPDEQRVPSAQLSPRSPNSPPSSLGTSSGRFLGGTSNFTIFPSSDDPIIHQPKSPQVKKSTFDIQNESVESRPHSRHTTDIMSAEWAQIQAIELVNDGTGLGFGIISARTSGVIVKTILPGGVADRDGRLLSGDHILQIGDVNLHEMSSEDVASVLRQSGTHVRLVVARPIDPQTPLPQRNEDVEGCAIVPARLLSDPNELERYLIAAGYPEIFGPSSNPATPLSGEPFNYQVRKGALNISSDIIDLPETERFNVELIKDANGLGITIAGYVCEKEELSGIFVKSVSSGSAADLSGRIQVNDRIVEVDQQSLQGFSNHQAVEVLKKSGTVVNLCLERYLRGPKYEQLQQAILANESKPAIVNVATTPIMGPGRPHSVLSMGSHHSVSPSSDHRTVNFSSNDHQHEIRVDSDTVPLRKPITQVRNSIEAKNPIALDVILKNEQSLPINLPTSSATGNQPLAKIEPIVQATNQQWIAKHKYWIESELTDDIEQSIKRRWKSILGGDYKIIVAQIRKFAASSGLGISLEGTVDVEGGVEVRPHHYIRSILPEGPVGKNGLLRSGDELLEVNGQRLLGMNHLEVVSILKDLPQDVRMVCGRGTIEMVPFTEENVRKTLGMEVGNGEQMEHFLPTSDRLVKAKSDGSLATSGSISADDSLTKLKSRSLEPLTGLAMWSSEPQIIELVKGERGLGFSILDYQDPLDANDTLIVIRSLVPGGVAQLDGRLIPGDRLLFVNDIKLENSSLDQAVQALKGAQKGIVRIGVAKPLPMADNSSMMNLSHKSHSQLAVTDRMASNNSDSFGDQHPAWTSK